MNNQGLHITLWADSFHLLLICYENAHIQKPWTQSDDHSEARGKRSNSLGLLTVSRQDSFPENTKDNEHHLQSISSGLRAGDTAVHGIHLLWRLSSPKSRGSHSTSPRTQALQLPTASNTCCSRVEEQGRETKHSRNYQARPSSVNGVKNK